MASLIPEAPIPIALEVQAISLSTTELEVIQWLESIGFEKYQQKFVAADIFSLAIVLKIESVDDLQELGIPKFPAKALMDHILELKAHGFIAPPGGSDGTGKEDKLLIKIEAEKEAAEAEAAAVEAKRLRQVEEEERLAKIQAEKEAAVSNFF